MRSHQVGLSQAPWIRHTLDGIDGAAAKRQHSALIALRPLNRRGIPPLSVWPAETVPLPATPSVDLAAIAEPNRDQLFVMRDQSGNEYKSATGVTLALSSNWLSM